MTTMRSPMVIASVWSWGEGDPAALVLNTKKLHLFDKETEQAIAH